MKRNYDGVLAIGGLLIVSVSILGVFAWGAIDIKRRMHAGQNVGNECTHSYNTWSEPEEVNDVLNGLRVYQKRLCDKCGYCQVRYVNPGTP